MHVKKDGYAGILHFLSTDCASYSHAVRIRMLNTHFQISRMTHHHQSVDRSVPDEAKSQGAVDEEHHRTCKE